MDRKGGRAANARAGLDPTDSSPSLIVVSNRLPYNVPKDPGGRSPKRNVGGLVNALEPLIARRGGAWIGWDGLHLASAGAVASTLAHPIAFTAPSGIDLHGVPLSEREVARYYHGFSNRALWPLFHGFPAMAVFSPEDYVAYVRVNHRFAERTAARVGGGSQVWVHDFHLLMVPFYLREMGFRGRIDFFLHIPFPALEIYRALPWRAEMVRGLLGADTIGFHTEQYRDNFVAAAGLLGGARIQGNGSRSRVALRHDSGKSVALSAPIGCDVQDFERVADLPAVKARTLRIREAHPGAKIVLGADRLDYTKGIRHRLKSFEQYLLLHPEAAGKVVLIQVVVPSRHQVEEYRTMKREIDQEVGRINGEQGREGWFPIHYLYRALDREELVSYYRAADVAFITPLRDGMNLVAAEFAAARTDEDGVLVVSEFAGIAERANGAVIINPYDIHGTARALSSALKLGPGERKARMRKLRTFVRGNTLGRWARDCIGSEEPERQPPRFRRTPLAVGPPAIRGTAKV